VFFSNKVIEKVIILRIVVGDLILNQNLNMALSHYGLNLKELKTRLDLLTVNLPKGLYLYFNFILYKNSTYDIILKGPTLSTCVLMVLTNVDNDIHEEYNVTFSELVLCYKLKVFLNDLLSITFYSDFFFGLMKEYKQLLGTISSFNTL